MNIKYSLSKLPFSSVCACWVIEDDLQVIYNLLELALNHSKPTTRVSAETGDMSKHESLQKITRPQKVCVDYAV